MKIDIEQLRKDIETGTPGGWHSQSAFRYYGIRVCAVGGIPIAEIFGLMYQTHQGLSDD